MPGLVSGRRRRRAFARGLAKDLTPPAPGAFRRFGRSVIVPPARVESPQHIEIGDGVVVHEGVWMSVVPEFAEPPRLVIGDRVVIGRFVQLSCVGGITIEEDVLIGDQVQIGDTFHAYDDPWLPSTKQRLAEPQPVHIRRGAMLGAGTVVLPGVTIGASAIVQGESVVTADVAPGTTVGGNPARPLA
jgi:acetyltransferase-like isoleucine patch superfamily enzyme